MPQEFTLRQVRYFVAVAEAGSLSAAAEKLYVSQPALSSAVTELETSLGVQLCVRQKSRGVELTPNGQSFYEQARRLLRDADEMTWSVRASGGPLRGPLTVGSYLSLAPELIPHYLTEFPKLEPEVTLNYVEGSTVELERMLLKGELDVAILYNLNLDPRLQRRTLFEKRPQLLLPADHPLVTREAVHLRLLQDEPFIQLSTSPATSHTANLFSAAGVVPNLRYHASNAELAQQLVAKRLGYTILLAFPRREEIYRELGVVRKAILPRPTSVPVVAAWPAATQLSARTRAFLDFLAVSPQPGSATPAVPGTPA